MSINIDDLLKGQSTTIKGNEFLSTEAYITPFLDRVSKLTNDFVCRAISPNQLSINKNGEVNSLYNKVLIEAVIPYDGVYATVVGMSYALDVKKPICKFFVGIKENLESGHLYLNNSHNIVNQEIEAEKTLNYTLLDRLLETDNNIYDWCQNLKTIDFDSSNDNVNYKLGQWVRFAINFNVTNEFGVIKIAAADIISAYKMLFEDSKSPYFVSMGAHTEYSRIYNAFSKVVYDSKDIVNIPDKTYLLKDILSIV